MPAPGGTRVVATPSRAAASVVLSRASVRARVGRSVPSDCSGQGDRPGKPSLVLDLVEEFRAYAVDRCVYALLNQRVPLGQDDHGRLDEATRTTLARRVNERLEAEALHEGRRRRLRTIVQSQARRIATYVRGEPATYTPWVGRW